MAEEQNWDEVLITNNPESKEIEVSFKRIDGDGFFGGTPGGAVEDGNGCVNAIGLVSDDAWLLQTGEPHWVWITLRSIPTEEYTVALTFTDGTLLSPEYTTQTLEVLISPGSWEPNEEGVTGIKVPLTLGDVSRLTDVGTDTASYGVSITAVDGIATDCWQADPVTLNFSPTTTEAPPEDEGGDGDPVDPDEPPCEPHNCTAYSDFLEPGLSNILRTFATSAGPIWDSNPQQGIDAADGWHIADTGSDAGVAGRFAIGGPYITDDGINVRSLAHLKRFDGLVDWTTHVSEEALAPDNTVLAYADVIDDLDGVGGCTAGHLYAVRFGTVRRNWDSAPCGNTSDYSNRDEQAHWAAYGVNPSIPVNPLVFDKDLEDPEDPRFEIVLVEPVEHAEYLTHAVVESEPQAPLVGGMGKIPDTGRLKFLAGNGGRWTTYVLAGGNVGNEESAWFREVYCTLDYANETMTLSTFQLDEDSYANPLRTVEKTISVPRHRMTNCWVKSRMSVVVALRPAPGFFDVNAHFLEHYLKVEVSLGDYVTMEITGSGRSNFYCPSPFAEVNPGNFTKFWHPDGTGAGNNVNFVGISNRGLQFGENSAEWQGNDLTPITLACTLGNKATDFERKQWARQWKAYQTQDYCNRIP